MISCSHGRPGRNRDICRGRSRVGLDSPWMPWTLLHMDFDGNELRAGKSGRRERKGVLGKLRGDCPFLKNNGWVQHTDEMEEINLESLFVVLWGESWYRRIVGHGGDIVTALLGRFARRSPRPTSRPEYDQESMPSTKPSTIPLYSLPFLNSQNARNGEVLIDQPAIGRRTLPDDEDEEEEGEADAEAEADTDRDSEGLGGANHHPATASTHTRGVLARARARGGGGGGSSPSSLMIKPAWRLHLYNLLERPNSSAAAVLVHVVVTALIVFSALVTILETVPGTLRSLPGGIWFGLETSLVALFTVEYVARCAATSYSWSSLFGWVGCAFILFIIISTPPALSSGFLPFFFLFLWSRDPEL